MLGILESMICCFLSYISESEMSIEDVKSKNDTNKDPDFIFCDGDQSKNGLRAATLEKLVEFCVCEFDFGG